MRDEPSQDSPAPVERPIWRRRAPGLLFALLLIGLGGALLASDLGIVSIHWEELARYWPVLLILVGLDILIGRGSQLGSIVMALITIGTLGGLLWLTSGAPAPPRTVIGTGQQVSGQIDQALGGATSLKVTIDLSAASLTLGAGAGSDFAAQGEWTAAADLQPQITYRVEGQTGILSIQQPSQGTIFSPPISVSNHVTLDLPRGIPVELEVSDDLGATTLDLTNLSTQSLDLKAGSGTVDVTLPEAGQMSSVNVHGDLGAVAVRAPEKATLNIDTLDVQAGSGALDVGLPATGTIDHLTVKGDLGQVTVSVADDSPLQIGPVDIESSSGRLSVALPARGQVGDVTIKGDLGAVEVTIPGTTNSLRSGSFDARSGSGSLTVTLPGQGTYQANLQCDLGSITVWLPASLEAHIEVDAGLSAPAIRSTRLQPAGKGTWETANYKEGNNRALVSIQAGSGGVTLQDQ